MKIAISIENEAEYNELMERLESKGYSWASGRLPTARDMQDAKRIDIDTVKTTITYENEIGVNSIPFSDLKANDFKLTIQL